MNRINSQHQTKREAESWLAERRAELNKGLLLEPNRVTFAEYANNWLRQQIGIRAVTRAGYQFEIDHALEKRR